MTLQQLRYVIQIVESGSFNSAAKALFISQPSLSKSIHDLEEEMSICLFVRTNKGILLSEQGEKFLGYARQVIEQANLLEEQYKNTFPARTVFAILSTFLITTHMESLPKSLFEMATIEGASDFKIFYYIALPLSKPILATVCITTLISSWNNYIWPLVSANAEKVRPVILQVSKVVASTYQMPGVNFAAYVIASVPLLLIFTVATKPFVEGLTAGAVKA